MFDAGAPPRRLRRLESRGRLRQPHRLAAGALLLVLSSASCDSASKSPNTAPADVADDHAGHDCSRDHPQPEPPPAARVTALSPEARSRLTTLRVSAHVGNVIVRRQGSDWIAAGADGCSVKPRRVERALDNLSALKALPSNDRPADGSSFELQIVALIGQERALHFDVADRKPEGDLVQLTDDSTFRVQGLDRSLWSPDPTVWCAEP